MSTNYYLHRTCPNPCKHCVYPSLHIGKYSSGWQFNWQAHPELEINTFLDWARLFDEPGNSITNEYMVPVAVDEFYDMVNATRSAPNKSPEDDCHYLDPHCGMMFTRVDFC